MSQSHSNHEPFDPATIESMPPAPELPPAEDLDSTFHAPIPDEELVDIIQQHLILGGEPLTLIPSQSSVHKSISIASPRIDSDHNDIDSVVTPFHLPGAAVTNDIYKMANDLVQRNALNRSRSLTDLLEYRKQDLHSDPALQNINKPGGFRRYYVHQHGHLTPSDDDHSSLQRYNSMMDQDFDQFSSAGQFKRTRHFLEFLAMSHIGIFDNFAGEDLEDTDDDVPEIDEEQARRLPVRDSQDVARSTDERTPLMRRKSSHMADKGSATETKALFLLLKAFIGSGVLFLPRAFSNGGLLFSFFSMWAMGSISLFSFLLLIECKDHVSGSYGDLGGALYGPWMRRLVLFSVAISQVSIMYFWPKHVRQNFLPNTN
jgi:proton-coupled amino acid transporter